MDDDFTFPLALCKAQWSIGLHGLAMLETCGAQCLSLGAHMLETQARAFWSPPPAQALPTSTAKHAADTAPSRNEVVQDAVRTLTAVLNAHPVRRRRKSRAGPSRGTS